MAQNLNHPLITNISQRSFTLSLNLVILFVVVALIAGGAGGFFGGQYFIEPVAEGDDYEVVKKADLPLSLDILTSSLHYQWIATSEGTLVYTEENFFILEKDGQRQVFKIAPLSRFADGTGIDQETELPKPIELSDIPIGSVMTGGSFISVNPESTDFIVRSFVITSRP